MTQPIKLTDHVYAVEVPEGAEGFDTSLQDDGVPCLTYWYKDNLDPSVICLPLGNWQLICTTKEVTALHAPELFGHAMMSDHYARETINAQISAKNRDPNKNYILIKKLP